MINRRILPFVESALTRQAAVALIGPRQVGKTTLAFLIKEQRSCLYLDLENPADRQKLSEPTLLFAQYENELVILDEIHRVPDLFPVLRGIIDQGRRQEKRYGRFLLLGSASIDLLRQSGESLAGRIAYVDMGPFDVLEVVHDSKDLIQLWVRGGFPDSYLAPDDGDSLALRQDFIRTYLERDVSLFGPRLPAETLRRLWTMLAHGQGSLLNASRLASNLALSAQTVTRYIDLLVDLLLVRRLTPFHANTKKRLVKAPKVYVRDTGLLHALLGIETYNDLAGHPVIGASWEGLVIENLLSISPPRTSATFYRTSAGAEIDLILQFPNAKRWAIEMKNSLTPSLERGFYSACDDVRPDRSFVVYPGNDRYPLSNKVEAISLYELASLVSDQSQR
jgi:predicted AAA+ superfamily ATPase